MKQHTRTGRPGQATTVDRPGSVEEIDLDRVVWDPEYRRAVKPLLRPAKAAKRAEPRRGGLRRPD